MSKSQSHLGVLLTIAIAFLLTFMPLPYAVQHFRPHFLLLTLIYWALYFSEGVGVSYAFTMGLILDIFGHSLLGENAFAFAVIVYLTHKVHLRLRLFPFWQQIFVVSLFIGVYQLLILWVEGTVGHVQASLSYWWPLLSSISMWPLVTRFLGSVKRH